MRTFAVALTFAAGFSFSAQMALAQQAPSPVPTGAPAPHPLAVEAAALTAPIIADAATTEAAAQAAPAPAPATPTGVTPQQLVNQVNIPFETFTLANGLRVVVHEDRKAPVVAVSMWYNVGSKDEPAGSTGFAHLFEHLMFNGSENAPGDWFQYTRQMGATDENGTTWFDRTNYFETVPRGALERTLFLESDRMGHLLGAITQEVLDEQRGVVQNEKRQGDNEPFGLVEYAQLEALFPPGHPYRHSTIGSMADLDAASLDTVRGWFRDNYGPNNAVLVLAGDINAAEARPLVERYFGDIPRGPVNEPAQADVPTLPARVDQVMRDRVANTRLYRDWIVPGLTTEDSVVLDVAADILGGLASSRLDNALVRGEQTAVSVTAGLQAFHRIGMFEVTVNVRPGQDADAVSRRLDDLIADYVRTGPTQDEVQRAVMRTMSQRIRGLEQVGGFGGKAVALAEGALYANDPNFYQTQLRRLAAVTPEQVRAMMQRWLTRPVYALRVEPGEREAYQESNRAAPVTTSGRPPAPAPAPTPAPAPAPRPSGGTATPHHKSAHETKQATPAPAPASAPAATPARATPARQMPPISGDVRLRFPAIERARLSNGIQIVYARSATVPVTRVSVDFNAGIAADPANRLGTQALMLNLLTEGTTHLNSVQLAETEERLGADLNVGASLDRTTVGLVALTPNLGASLDLLADVIRNPAFAPAEVERLRAQQLARIASEMTQPQNLALRALPPIIYGTGHPYGRPFSGTGDPAVVRTVTRDELVAFHQRWIRPDNAQIFVVSDQPLATIRAQLESRFGAWRAPAGPRGTKTFGTTPAAQSRIILINRPQSPQSLILGGQVLPVVGTSDVLPLTTANELLGGDFLARINMELRERRHWSYGAFGITQQVEHNMPYLVVAPVQSDQTGPSLAALREQISGFLTTNGVTAEELERTIQGNTRELPGSFETSAQLMGALRRIEIYRLPDTYYANLPARLRGFTQASLDQAIRRAVNPNNFLWVIIGDASVVRPQLANIGLPVEERNLDGTPVAPAPTTAQ